MELHVVPDNRLGRHVEAIILDSAMIWRHRLLDGWCP